MHFHLPKPLHGWRQLIGEVGIIVVGVLIALSAEQLVEEWRWKQRTDEARQGIRAELAQDAGVFDERTINKPCLLLYYSEVGHVLKAALASGRIGKISLFTPIATRPITTAAWDAALADGTASHFPAAERQKLAVIYSVVADYRRQLDEEWRLSRHLKIIENSRGEFSGTMLADIYSNAPEIGYRNMLTTAYAEQQLSTIRNMGIAPAYESVLGQPGTRAELVRLERSEGGALPNCTPVTVDGKPVPIPRDGPGPPFFAF